MAGLASVTATMLREGTATRTSKQIADESDRLAASIGGNSGFGAMEASFAMSGLTDNFDQVVRTGSRRPAATRRFRRRSGIS